MSRADMYVIKDLVPDMTNFYDQYKSVKPWLQLKVTMPYRIHRQTTLYGVAVMHRKLTPLSITRRGPTV
jgi:succinate dehydrogenase/fumarate reductase-like Fe-S protein